MNLAAILGVSLLSVGIPGLVYPSVGMPAPAVFSFAAQQPTSQEPSGQKSPAGDSAAKPQVQASGSTRAPSGTAPHHKKKSRPCSNSPSALNPAPGNSGDSATAAGTGTGKSDPSSADSANTDSTEPTANKSSAPLKPCPPPKKVVRNGGSEEPSIQLVGGTTADQASQQRSTEQLTAATEENLRKIAGRPLNPNQQELVNQVKQFMDQSKTAVSTGDLEGGHNLAQKAHLLSQELVKP